MKRAIFLDRDGVINEKLDGYVTSWDEFRFCRGAIEGIRELAGLGWPIAVVTNQSAIGRGFLSEDGLTGIHRRMVSMVKMAGGRIDLIQHCPHTPADACSCRKPEVEMFRMAAWRLGVSLAQSYYVGDAPSDLEAARRLGMRFVAVGDIASGVERTGEDSGILAAENLLEGARWIVERESLSESELSRVRLR